jgi:hypothetical protein
MDWNRLIRELQILSEDIHNRSRRDSTARGHDSSNCLARSMSLGEVQLSKSYSKKFPISFIFLACEVQILKFRETIFDRAGVQIVCPVFERKMPEAEFLESLETRLGK